MKPRLLLLLGCLVILAFGRPLPAAAQDKQPDLTAYTALLREAAAAAQRSDRIGLEAVSARIAQVSGVRLEDGTVLPVDNRWLAEALRADAPDFAAISARLGALLEALALPPGTAPADARERLRQILANPPFQQNESQAATWLGELVRWIGRLIESLLRPAGSLPAGSGSVIAWTVGIVGGLLLLLVLGYLALGLRRGMVAEGRAVDDDPEANLTARTAFDQAGDMARSGDYRIAMRYLYLAALLWLDERGKLRYDRALTNREYLERVADNPALRERLAPVVETFDRVWYGHAPLDEETFAAYRRQVEELRRES